MEYIHRLRQKWGKERALIPATALVILDAKEQVCMHLREDTNSWGLPGGLMDIGETAVESIVREAREETGLIVRNPQLYGVFSGPKFHTQYPSGDQTAPVILGFYTSDFSGSLQTGGESLEVQWFPLDQIPENMNKSHRMFLEGYLEFRKSGKPVAR